MSLDFAARGFVQVLAAFAVATALTSILVGACWRAIVRRRDSDPVHQAHVLFIARLLPAAAGVIVALSAALSYLLLEPDVESEIVGLPALALAALGSVILAHGLVRGLAAIVQALGIARRLDALAVGPIAGMPVPALKIESAFPVVALVGVVRPRLYVARGVIDACTREELDSVIAHELAHAGACDNLRRLLFRSAPDLLNSTARGARMERDWSAVAELAADESAVRSHPEKRLHLAAALVTVARLAAGQLHTPLPASALYRGESVADRVRRLVDEPAPLPSVSRWGRARIGVATAGLLLLAALAMPALHKGLETLIALGL